MKRITKRIFSAILSAIMLILALPLTSFAASKTYVDYGDIIEFGSYPQTQVKDAELIKKLDNIGIIAESIALNIRLVILFIYSPPFK